MKAVVSAYDGSVKLYVIDNKDPMLRAYRKAFPHMFTEATKMPQGPRRASAVSDGPLHRADRDVLRCTTPRIRESGTRAAAVGQYVSAAELAASAARLLLASSTASATGRVQSSGPRAGDLQYLIFHLPGDANNTQSFVLTRSFVPASPSGATDNQLTSFMAARSDGFNPNDPNGGGTYGQLVVYQVSSSGSNEQTASPFLAANQIQADQTISSKLSLLDQHGSSVQLGTVQLLPLGNSIAYVQPVYVQAAGDSTFPRLTFLAAYANDHAILLSGASASIAVADTLGTGNSSVGTL